MKIGYQLYSALPRCQGAEALKDTIRKIAAMGYDVVEFCSYEGISSGEMKAFLAECSIEACNSHVQLERWEVDLEGEIRYAAELGMPCLTIPWLAPELRSSEGYKKIRDMIPSIAEQCRAYGVKLLYHNHDFEFAREERGGYVLDAMLDADKDLGLELDTFWAWYAKADPAAYMTEKKERLAMIHVKDYEELSGGGMAGGLEMPVFCAIGAGKMKQASIISCAKRLELPWVVVEQDNSKIDVLESAQISIKALRSLI